MHIPQLIIEYKTTVIHTQKQKRRKTENYYQDRGVKSIVKVWYYQALVREEGEKEATHQNELDADDNFPLIASSNFQKIILESSSGSMIQICKFKYHVLENRV